MNFKVLYLQVLGLFHIILEKQKLKLSALEKVSHTLFSDVIKLLTDYA